MGLFTHSAGHALGRKSGVSPTATDQGGLVRRALLASFVTGGARRIQISGGVSGDASIMTQRFDEGDEAGAGRAARLLAERLDHAVAAGERIDTRAGSFVVEPTPFDARYRVWDPGTGFGVVMWAIATGHELHVVMHDSTAEPTVCHPA